MKINYEILKSILILVSVSLGGGFLALLVGWGFLFGFLSTLLLQFILFNFFLELFKHYITENRIKKELEVLEPLSTVLECAYCHKQNLMIFNPNDTERIEFECDHCKKRNLVNLQFVVAQISEPLEIPKVVGIPSEKV